MNRKNFFISLCLIAIVYAACTPAVQEQETTNPALTLWYPSPAEKWANALPLGNGRLAAMVYGGVDTAHFKMNEESLWAGSQANPVPDNFNNHLKEYQQMILAGDLAGAHAFGLDKLTASPTSFRSFEPLGDLFIDFLDQDESTAYKRQLDMSTGLSTVRYTVGGHEIVRQSFISAVDNALCIRISASDDEKINCVIRFERFKDAQVVASEQGEINIEGQIVDVEAPAGYDDNSGASGAGGNHMKFAGQISAKTSDGVISPENDKLLVRDADELVIVFSAATDYNLSLMNFDRSLDPVAITKGIVADARKKDWDSLLSAHLKEHTALFNKVQFTLGTTEQADLPTDARIAAIQQGATDNDLMAQMFQFGRYLLMSSSRAPGKLPANLQGIWSEREWAPWEADYHLNVNLQMNYWPADVCHLSATVDPLVGWFEQLTQYGEPVAKEMFNADGWCSGHATNPFGRVTPSASSPASQFNNGVLDMLAGAWMVMNLWDHYEYTQDKTLLKRIYPMLIGASQFIIDALVPDSQGTLHFIPSASPENAFADPATGEQVRGSATSTYHLSVIKAVFAATLEASEILNEDDPVCKGIQRTEKLLPPFKIDDSGRLMEWSEDYQELISTHRHFSHLLGVHPFAMITEEDTPPLFAAAQKSLEVRLAGRKGSTGWSGAQAALLSAWFGDTDSAYNGLKHFLEVKRNKTFMHIVNIFQIDANFGMTAVIAEMLIQSHKTDQDGIVEIELLPSLPDDWARGSVSGLCTRGGFVVDMEWADGKITSAEIRSKTGGRCKVRIHDQLIDVSLKEGETRTLTL